MGNERARQKKLAKQKRKRADANRRGASTITKQRPDSAALGRAAAAWEFDGAWLSAGWDDTKDPALVTGVLLRRGAAGDLAVGVILVDRTCLGIKSGWVRKMTRDRVHEMLDQVASAHGGVVPVDLLTLQSVAFHAAEYARSLGFTHDPDFPLEFLGPRPEALLDTPFARPAKPLFVAGPNDDAFAIISHLERRMGRGNYDYLAPLGPFGEGDLDDAEIVGELDEDDDERLP